MARRAKSYVIYGESKELYRRSPTGILQRCITIEEGRKLFEDLHLRACRHHAAPRTLVGNDFRQGFYWPKVVADAIELVRSCHMCQLYAKQTQFYVERANGMILQGLKPRIYNRLKKFGKKWVKELSLVLWSLRPMPSRATKYTPFFMVYGSEVVLPTDLEYGSPRLKAYNK